MGELFELARTYGEVVIGDSLRKKDQVTITLSFTKDDYMKIYENGGSNVLENLGRAINRAEKLRAFYISERWV
jgi:hypothetical protein